MRLLNKSLFTPGEGELDIDEAKDVQLELTCIELTAYNPQRVLLPPLNRVIKNTPLN